MSRGPVSWVAIAMSLFLLAAPPAGAADYEIDAAHSAVIFKVKHMGVAYTYGRFNDISGKFTFDPDNPGNSSFDVTVKAESVDSNDAKRDQHLRSPDFFNAKQFPTITLKSNSVKKKGDGSFEATGELMLHGVKKTITVEVEHVGSGDDPWGNYRSGFETVLTVKRSDFGMSFMPEGIGDEVKVTVSIEGIRQ